MAERFERLFQLPDNLYIENSPVIVRMGVLLKDSISGSIVVQIKYHSVSSKPIKALKIDISAMDVSGQHLQGVEDYQYLDLNILNGMEFGSNKAIVMPVAITRSFSISKITVVFTDGNTWVSSAEMIALPEEKLLQSIMENPELLKQYQLATSTEAKYVPFEHLNLWKCTCGEWNSDSKCCKCGCEKAVVLDALNIEALGEKMEIRLATEKEQREEQARLLEIERQEQAEREKVATEKEAQRKKYKKKKLTIMALIAVPILIISLAFSLWIYPSFIKPIIIEKQFDKAMTTLKESASHSEKDILDALSLVMTASLENRLKYADSAHEVYGEEYYRNVLSAEEPLLSIGELNIKNQTVKQAFLAYVYGLEMQKQVFDQYSSTSNSNYDNLANETDWIAGRITRITAIMKLYEEGVLLLSNDEYGIYCVDYIEMQLLEELNGSQRASWYDDDHYCVTVTIKNDTLASFKGFEVRSLWDDEEVCASVDKWESGETWEVEFIVSSTVLEDDSISLELEAYYHSMTVKKPR